MRTIKMYAHLNYNIARLQRLLENKPNDDGIKADLIVLSQIMEAWPEIEPILSEKRALKKRMALLEDQSK